jgi:dimethylamine/trimethylamine dehydrogenase
VGRVDPVLIVGAAPAGLEAAVTLARRGVPVLLAEAAEPGGRVTRESRLPGLAEWARVRDWRLHQISKLAQVQLFPGSVMQAEDIIDTAVAHVFLATGSLWRADGRGRSHCAPVASFADQRTMTLDRILEGARPGGDL